MTQARINRFSFAIPLLLSVLAFLLAMANVIAAVPPQADENASAHLWQLLMILQMPMIIVFLFTADWRSWSPAYRFAAQIGALMIAALPVLLAGY